MTIYEQNKNTLFTTAPYLKNLSQRKKTGELECIPTPTGSVSGKFKGHYIHSRHNPVREATQLIEREVKEDISSALFYGFGLGFQVEAFAKRYPRIPILIIEPDPEFFHTVIESRDLTHLFQLKNIMYYVDDKPDGILHFIEQLPLSHIQVIRLRSMYSFHTGYYKQIDGIVQSYLSKKEVNVNTLRRFGKLWVKNLVHNIPHIIEKPGISLLANAFRDIPCLVLASGPSLDTVLPYLAELHQRMLIISVDTSLRACVAQGVDPDFLIIVDPQYWNSRHLDWVSCKKTLLISESSTHPRVFRELGIDGFFASSFFPLGQFFESIVGEKGKIGAGGSVATSAWDIGRRLGASPIVMGGLDLGFPGKKTHFHGAYFEECFHMIADRFSPLELKSYAYLRDGQPFPIPANNGTTVLTDKRMIIYKWWFETQMKTFPGTPTLTLSPGGVAIPGIEVTDIQTLLDLQVKRQEIDRIISHIKEFKPSPEKINRSKEKCKDAVKKLMKDIRHLVVLADQGIQATRKAAARLSGGKIPRDLMDTLNQVDEKISNTSSRLITGFLLQPIIQGLIHTASGNKTPEEILSYSERFYTELKDSCDYHVRMLKKADSYL